MKKLVLAGLMLCLGGVWPVAHGQIVVGTGTDYSYLVIEGFGSPLVYEYHYTYNPGSPLDSYGLFSAVDAADSLLSATFVNYGTLTEPNYFLDSISYNAVTLSNTGAPTYSPYWAQWVSGGSGGFITQGPYPNGTWSFGDGMSSPYREIAPGSWDAFIYNDGSSGPVTATVSVPEPSTVLLLLLALGMFVLRRVTCAKGFVAVLR